MDPSSNRTSTPQPRGPGVPQNSENDNPVAGHTEYNFPSPRGYFNPSLQDTSHFAGSGYSNNINVRMFPLNVPPDPF